MRIRNKWTNLTLAQKHCEEQQKIDHLQEREEKISTLRATEKVKQTLQEKELDRAKKQGCMTSDQHFFLDKKKKFG